MSLWTFPLEPETLLSESGEGRGLSLGALELNVFIAGVGALAWLYALREIVDWPRLPQLPSEWQWWLAPAGVVAVVATSLLGLLVEGAAGIVERVCTRKGPIRDRIMLRTTVADWYAEATHYTDQGWSEAQRWMWLSPQAASEYARRRLRILVARNTAFNLFVLTFFVEALVARDVGCVPALAAFAAGQSLTALLVFVWIDANKAFHRAIADAGRAPKA